MIAKETKTEHAQDAEKKDEPAGAGKDSACRCKETAKMSPGDPPLNNRRLPSRDQSVATSMFEVP